LNSSVAQLASELWLYKVLQEKWCTQDFKRFWNGSFDKLAGMIVKMIYAKM